MAAKKKDIISRIENLSGAELELVDNLLTEIQKADINELKAAYLAKAGEMYSRIPVITGDNTGYTRFHENGVYSRMQKAERARNILSANGC